MKTTGVFGVEKTFCLKKETQGGEPVRVHTASIPLITRGGTRSVFEEFLIKKKRTKRLIDFLKKGKANKLT